MGTDMGDTTGGISLPRACEGVGQRRVGGPSLEEVQLQIETRELPDGLLPVRLEPRHEVPPELGDLLTQTDQLWVPRGRLVWDGAQGRVALLERPGVPGPDIDEVWFHVEHGPVHPTTTALGTLLDQLVRTWLDDLNGEGSGQLGE